MDFDLRALPKDSRYKIMSSCITPRPIAWVTSRSLDGLINAAPYSFFNMLGDEPPILALGLLQHGDARLKDTAFNIREAGEFVVNLVSEDHGEAMNLTCIDAPADISEVNLAGLELAPSAQIATPRIKGVPASFECQVLHALETGPHQLVVIAEVLHAHIRDEFVQDPDRLYIDTPAMKLLARMHGAGWYSRQTDLFQMERPTRMPEIGDLI